MDELPKERPKVGIGVIIQRGDKILIGKRLTKNLGQDTYQIVGGHLEFGETFEQGAQREVTEETGLTDLAIKDVISLGNDIAYNKHYISIGILAESLIGEPVVMEPEACGGWEWCDPHNLPQPFFPHSERVIKNWLSKTFYNKDRLEE